jgi:flagellar motor switch protein FliN/FliY
MTDEQTPPPEGEPQDDTQPEAGAPAPEETPGSGEAPGSTDPGAGDAESPEAAIDDAQSKLDETAEVVEDVDEPTEEEAAALAAVQAAIAGVHEAADAAPSGDSAPASGGSEASGATAFAPPVFESVPGSSPGSPIDMLRDVNLNVTIELGRTRMLVEDVLRLGEGAVVELDKLAGDPVDVHVNGRLVARGEVLVLNDSFCVRVNEILDPTAEDAEG